MIYKNNKKQAFTLAEMLITLGLIGIVASITIPNLITNYRAKEIEAKAKTNYSTFQQISQLNQEFASRDFSGANGPELWFQSFITRGVSSTTPCQGEIKCFENIKTLNNQSVQTPQGRMFILPDGTTYNIFSQNQIAQNYFVKLNGNIDNTTNSIVVWMDANGYKKPNIIGKDIYIMVWNGQKLVPAGYNASVANVDTNCSLASTGYLCMQNLINSGWQIKKEIARKL